MKEYKHPRLKLVPEWYLTLFKWFVVLAVFGYLINELYQRIAHLF